MDRMTIGFGWIECPCGWRDEFTPPLQMTANSHFNGLAFYPFLNVKDARGKVISHFHYD